MDAPLLLKIFTGPIYLLLFPIPFWSGLNGQYYSYFVFMSFNSLFSIFMLPYLLCGIIQIFRNKIVDLYFSLFIFSCYLISIYIIVFTTLQNRHLLAFIPFQIIIISMVDFTFLKKYLQKTKIYLLSFFILLQLSWVLIKFLN